MLGRGRPFVVEVCRPKYPTLLKEEVLSLQEKINQTTYDIAVRDLQIVSKSALGPLKDGEESKRKTYSCIVWLSKEISQEDVEKIASIKHLVVYQKTPLRVLHR